MRSYSYTKTLSQSELTLVLKILYFQETYPNLNLETDFKKILFYTGKLKSDVDQFCGTDLAHN